MINPKDYMIDLKGKQYLPVAPRIVMMREEHPDWSVTTEPVSWGDSMLVKATITDGAGRVIATGHKTVTSFRGFDIEKAETGAIGRALSIAGFGTIQAGDMDEGEQIADAPIEPATNGQQRQPVAKKGPDPSNYIDTGSPKFKAWMIRGGEQYGDEWDDKRGELCAAVTKGRTRSSKELFPAEFAKLDKGVKGRAA